MVAPETLKRELLRIEESSNLGVLEVNDSCISGEVVAKIILCVKCVKTHVMPNLESVKHATTYSTAAVYTSGSALLENISVSYDNKLGVVPRLPKLKH